MEKHIKGYSFLRGFLGFGFKLVYQIKITGKENIPVSGPVVVCGNHNHVHDQFPVILSTKRMIHYMAKKEYFDGKMAWFFRMAGCIPVDRSIKDESAKEEAISILEENEVFGIFPEGTCSKNGEVLPFKKGACRMAYDTDTKIVPFVIKGKYKLWSRDLQIEFFKPFKVKSKFIVEETKKFREFIVEKKEG